MSRVLLMIDNGDGRVKCAKQFGWNRAMARAYFAAVTKHMDAGEAGQPKRAWLVEAASADDARHCISGGCEPYRCHRADGPLHCRILAQGGRQ